MDAEKFKAELREQNSIKQEALKVAPLKAGLSINDKKRGSLASIGE